jgi:tRNA nucleotidyltransferase (CCA-adding enzyme)
MRALRFASTYGFMITKDTSDAVHYNAPLLNNIAKERINTELCRLLHGKGVLEILLNYNDIISTIIPEMKPCVGFDQNNCYHQYTVYDHIAHAVANYTGSDTIVKIALLLHDIGKPTCYTEDENGGHFRGHGVPSSDIAKAVVERLRFDNYAQRSVVELVLYHDATIEPTIKVVKRWLNKIGEQQLWRLLDIRMADILAHSEGTRETRVERCVAIRNIAKEIIASRQCFQLKDMAVNGNDLIAAGISQGKQIGETLNWLLNMVINGEAKNDKEELLNFVRSKN